MKLVRRQKPDHNRLNPPRRNDQNQANGEYLDQ
jgi:hypothetical protein